jgi:hypothetical protein
MSGIDAEWPLKILTKQFAGGTRSFLGRIEIMLHAKNYLAQWAQSAQRKTRRHAASAS